MRLHLSTNAILFAFAGAVRAESPKSNLPIVTADDMNADSAGCMGNKLGTTPNFDAFTITAHRSVNENVTVPICQPDRDAFLTGSVMHRSGALGFKPIRKDVPIRPFPAPRLPEQKWQGWGRMSR